MTSTLKCDSLLRARQRSLGLRNFRLWTNGKSLGQIAPACAPGKRVDSLTCGKVRVFSGYDCG